MISGTENNDVTSSHVPSTVISQYEALRTAILGEPLLPECRSGLVLFLRRGMWGWAQALVSTPQESARAPAPGLPAIRQHRAVIQIFAAMVQTTNHGRVR